jgi:protein-S-isoprenylcysteine O-methyltransferase Ste14
VQEAESSEGTGTSDVLSAVGGVLFLMQLLILVFLFNLQANVFALGAGWILIIPSFLLMTFSMASLDKGRGSSAAGESQPKLVTTGLYNMVRHPFHLGWALMAVSLALVSQTWLAFVLMILQMLVVYRAVIEEETLNLVTFGDAYASYKAHVPAVNLFQGACRFYKSRPERAEEAALPQD